jgi:hypothetical protein
VSARGDENIAGRLTRHLGTVGSARTPGDREAERAAAWAACAVVVSALLIVAVLTPVPAALRFGIAVVWVAIGPGTAILMACGGRSLARPELGLVVGLGLATTALVAESLIWLGLFNPRPEVCIAAAVVIVAVVAGWRWSFLRRPAAGQRPQAPPPAEGR